MDLKLGSVPTRKKSQSRHGLDLIFRLDGPDSQPKSKRREKLKKRKTENAETTPRNGKPMGEPGAFFRRRVSDTANGKVVVERQIHLESPQKDKTKSHSNQFGHWLGGSGFVLERKLRQHGGKPSNDVQGAAKGYRIPLSFSHAFKRVRFLTPSLVSAASAGDLTGKRTTLTVRNPNGMASKFYEKFDSKTTDTAAS